MKYIYFLDAAQQMSKVEIHLHHGYKKSTNKHSFVLLASQSSEWLTGRFYRNVIGVLWTGTEFIINVFVV